MQLQHRRRRGPAVRLLLEREFPDPSALLVCPAGMVSPGRPRLVVLTRMRVKVMIVMVRGDRSRDDHSHVDSNDDHSHDGSSLWSCSIFMVTVLCQQFDTVR